MYDVRSAGMRNRSALACSSADSSAHTESMSSSLPGSETIQTDARGSAAMRGGEEVLEQVTRDAVPVLGGRAQIVDGRDVEGERVAAGGDALGVQRATAYRRFGARGADDGGRDAAEGDANVADDDAGEVERGGKADFRDRLRAARSHLAPAVDPVGASARDADGADQLVSRDGQ